MKSWRERERERGRERVMRCVSIHSQQLVTSRTSGHTVIH